MPLRACLALLALTACAPSHRAAVPAGDAPLAITGVTVIPMTGGPAAPDQTILIRRGRIVSVLPTARATVPADAEVLDGRGRFAIPGLWDMHVHNAREGRARYFWPLFLAHGVTGVREMGSYLDTLLFWRAELARRPEAGPRVVWSTPMFDGSRASWTHAIALSGPPAARRMVDSMHALGFDFIKVYERLPRATYLAIAEQARVRGIPFAGHLPEDVDPVTAAGAGQGSIEHGFAVYFGCVPGALALLDSVRGPQADSAAAAEREMRLGRLLAGGTDAAGCAAAKALADAGTALTPTLTVQRSYMLPDTTRAGDPRNSLAPPPLVARWRSDAAAAIARRPAERRALEAAIFVRFVAFVGTLHRAGVPILAGTDASDEPYVYAGSSLHDELELLVSAGLTPHEALAAATVAPARFLGVADSLGTVEAGKLADLVVLDADPLADIRNTRRIHAVIRGGRLIDSAGVRALLDTARAEAARARPSPPARR